MTSHTLTLSKQKGIGGRIWALAALIPVLILFLALPAQTPAALTEQKLLPADSQTSDYFGYSVAISEDGTTAIIGAPQKEIDGKLDQGAAYVFIRSGGTWVQQQKLVASDGQSGDKFGWSVAISSDTVIVGTTYQAAYVFTRNGTLWSQQAKFTGDGSPVNAFGQSVAISGNSAVVGDSYTSPWWVDQGATYWYSRVGETWSSPLRLVGSQLEMKYGFSAAFRGTKAIIGSPYYNLTSSGNVGAAHLYSITDEMLPLGTFTADDGVASDYFGYSVGINDNTFVVWSPYHNSDAGAAYVFTLDITTFAQAAKLTAWDGGSGDNFGASVGITNGKIVVGAFHQDGIRGAVYVFTGSGSSWTQDAKLTASDSAESDYFGHSVAVSTGTVIVGAPRINQGKVGAVYVYGEDQPYVPIAPITPVNGQAFDVCSYFSPPNFDWALGQAFEKVELQFYTNANSTKPTKVKIKDPTVTQFQMTDKIWKKILKLPGLSGGVVNWKIVGMNKGQEPVESEAFTMSIDAPKTVDTLDITPTNKAGLPTVSWENNCGTKFKATFGSDVSFSKKKTVSFSDQNPVDNGGVFSSALSSGTWASIRKLVGDTEGSTIYWYVESWDIVKRYTKTDPLSFTLNP
jgi:hypothetical protein